MGREVRRAHKAFDWPLKQTWWGYLLPALSCQSCDDKEDRSGCPTCNGEGRVYPKVDPPAFELNRFPSYYANDDCYGWQIWETTSEGSPISPVCDSPASLARWLADNRASTFGRMTATYEQWLAMIVGPGSAPSAVVDGRGMRSGVEAVSDPPNVAGGMG